MNVDLIIAGRRIRLQCGDGITMQPDERFSSFMAEASEDFGTNRDAATWEETAGDGNTEPTGMAEAGKNMSGADVLRSSPGPDLTVEAESDLTASVAARQWHPSGPDLTVEVFPGRAEIPADAVKVFDARLMEETPEGMRNTGEPFWEVLTGKGMTFARIYLKDPVRNPVIAMPDGRMTWQIFSDCKGPVVNPLPYPLDGLLLYFLSSAAGDIMIHGSGVICGGRGWIFTGHSGSGKTTIAGIFDRAGDRVVHDDRLILRRDAGGWVMHSTPVYRNDEPRSAAIDHLWGITHGRANVSTPVTGAEAVAMVMSNCVQQNRDREAASRLAAAVEEMVSSVRVSRLSFLPDGSLHDYLIARESGNAVTAAEAASAILAEEKPVTISAGGYSMWPAVRPGDRVVVEPLRGYSPAQGDIVALRRDGGYVVHRVRKVLVSGGRPVYRTQGDAVTRADEPAGTGMIAGLVRSVVRSGRQRQPSPRFLPRWLNRLAALLISAIVRHSR